MPFLDAAAAQLNALHPDSAEARILTFLMEHGVGRINAQSWPAISAHLKELGISIRKQRFQHGLLRSSREGSLFIASTNQGYFLIQDRHDAEAMQAWYRQRIEVEQRHLDRLNDLIEEHFEGEP